MRSAPWRDHPDESASERLIKALDHYDRRSVPQRRCRASRRQGAGDTPQRDQRSSPPVRFAAMRPSETFETSVRCRRVER
jgi:hypothetical protein